MTRATGSRLRALVRSSPDRNVERLRWLALLSIGLAFGLFIYDSISN